MVNSSGVCFESDVQFSCMVPEELVAVDEEQFAQ